MARALGPPREVLGVDFSRSAVALCRKAHAAQLSDEGHKGQGKGASKRNLSFEQGDAESLEGIENERYDIGTLCL